MMRGSHVFHDRHHTYRAAGAVGGAPALIVVENFIEELQAKVGN